MRGGWTRVALGPAAALALVAVLPTPKAAATSAIRQLELISGQKIDRPRQGGSRAPSFEEQMTGQLMGGLMQGLLSGLFSDDAARQAEIARQRAEEARRVEVARRKAEEERRRRIKFAGAERARWRAETDDLEAMAHAMSEDWDGAGDADSLADALSDDSIIVDLRDRTSDAPALLRGPEPPVRSPEELARAKEKAERFARELREMSLENEDPEVLERRIAELRGRLSRVGNELRKLTENQLATVKQFEEIEESVRAATESAMKRGLSMALGPLMKRNKKILERLEKVKADSAAWTKMTKALKRANGFLESAVEAGEQAEQVRGQIDWGTAKRNLGEDLCHMAETLGVGGQYLTLGKSIIDSSANVFTHLDAMQRVRQGEENLLLQGKARTVLVERQRAIVEELNRLKEHLGRAGAPAAK